MARRTKLQNLARLTIPPSRCVVAKCTDEPQPGQLICFIHARALHKLTEEAPK